MRIAHLLRKYNPAEWGGTETVMHQMFDGLRREGVESIVYCPALTSGRGQPPLRDPLAEAGCIVRRFEACVPIWGISADQRRQMVAVGGNLMSFDLIRALWTAPRLALIHSHALGRVGGIGMTIARRRRIPFVVTVHGGVYDLPPGLRQALNTPVGRGVEWGKLFGMLLRARNVLSEADAIFTCNPREAELLRHRHPDRRVIVQPHGVRSELYEPDHRADAEAAFPRIRGRDVLLAVGRIDPVKNQSFLVEQLPEIIARHPRVLLVLAGPCTDDGYGAALERTVETLGLGQHVLRTGKIPPADPRLVGLMQNARAVLLPSISETFGLVILESWAAGVPAISSRTSGSRQLIEPGTTGWLFDLDQPAGFHEAIDTVLTQPDACRRVTAACRRRVVADYDVRVIAGHVRQVYGELVEENHAVRHSA